MFQYTLHDPLLNLLNCNPVSFLVHGFPALREGIQNTGLKIWQGQVLPLISWEPARRKG